MSLPAAEAPFVLLPLGRDGSPVGAAGLPDLEGATDVLVLAHGWKNDGGDAASLYSALLSGVGIGSGRPAVDGRRFAVVGIRWPALRRRRDLSIVGDDVVDDRERGGAATARSADVPAAALAAIAAAVAEDLGDDPVEFAAAAVGAGGGGGAADRFLDRLRGLLGRSDAETERDHRGLLRARGSDLLGRLAQGGAPVPVAPEAAEAGRGPGLGAGRSPDGGSAGPRWRVLSGGRAAVASVLNQASYFEMKARAGAVGSALADLLARIVPGEARVHLVGHSFGARLVASACRDAPGPTASLSLLQAAFSHNGLGTRIGGTDLDGAFRRVVSERLVTGPVLVTHSRNDAAVGLFYALASTASRDVAAGLGSRRRLGGPDDPHGALGANGARSMLAGEVAESVAGPGDLPPLVAGAVNNVQCDAVVAHHSDVVNADVTGLVRRAVLARAPGAA